MPINYITQKIYSINYASLKTELQQFNIFHDKTYQSFYLERWMAKLEEADKKESDDFFRPQYQLKYQQELLEAPENFQTEIIYDSNIILLHFKVSRLLQYLKTEGVTSADAEDIDVSAFSENRFINWTETEIGISKTDPIIMVPFPCGKSYRYLVIDGNHRISDAVKKGEKTIKSYSLGAETIVDNHMCCSEFDRLFYIFQNEMFWFSTFYNSNYDLHAEGNLVLQSYLNTSIVHYC